eukprot:jgi/Phyca11/503267/fgenesh2_kg.PHYCAscaffold_3_\
MSLPTKPSMQMAAFRSAKLLPPHETEAKTLALALATPLDSTKKSSRTSNKRFP